MENFSLKPSSEKGAVLYYAMVMLTALVVISLASSRNSINAINNANLIRLNTLVNNASQDALTMVQNFFALDLKNGATEVERIIINDITSDGLLICANSAGQGIAYLNDGLNTCTTTINVANQPELQIRTLTQFHDCYKESSSSTEANFILRTVVQTQVDNGRENRQEVYWKLTGFSNESYCL